MEEFILHNLENVTLKEYPNYYLLEPKARLDLSFSENFFIETINFITSNPKNIILNMKEVPYISSSGIKAILKLKQYLDVRGYKISLYHLLPEVQKIIHISELSNLLPIFDTLEQSIEYLKK